MPDGWALSSPAPLNFLALLSDLKIGNVRLNPLSTVLQVAPWVFATNLIESNIFGHPATLM